MRRVSALALKELWKKSCLSQIFRSCILHIDAVKDPVYIGADSRVNAWNCCHAAKGWPKGHNSEQRVTSVGIEDAGGAVVHEGTPTVAATHILHGLALGAQVVRRNDNRLLEVLAKRRIGNRTAGRVHNGQPDESHRR